MMQFQDQSRTKLSSDFYNSDSYLQAYELSHERYQRSEEEVSDAIARENDAEISRRRMKRATPSNVTSKDVVKFEIEDAKISDMEMSASQRDVKEVRGMRSPYEVNEGGQRIGPVQYRNHDDLRTIQLTHPIKRKGRVYAPEDFPVPVQKAINMVLHENKQKMYKSYENHRYAPTGPDQNKLYYGDKMRPQNSQQQVPEHIKNWWKAAGANRMKRLHHRYPQSAPVPAHAAPTYSAPQYQISHVHHSDESNQYQPTYLKSVQTPTVATPLYHLQQPNYYIKSVPLSSPYTVVNNEYQTISNVYSQKSEKTQNDIPTNPYGPVEIKQQQHQQHHQQQQHQQPQPKAEYFLQPQQQHQKQQQQQPTQKPEYETHYITVTEKVQPTQQHQYQNQFEYHTLPQEVLHQSLQQQYEDGTSIEQLQALIGQNPSEQLKGLKALLTQEVEQRPQDSTSPIDFGPNVPKAGPTKAPEYQYTVAGSIKQIVPIKQSTPIVETTTPESVNYQTQAPISFQPHEPISYHTQHINSGDGYESYEKQPIQYVQSSPKPVLEPLKIVKLEVQEQQQHQPQVSYSHSSVQHQPQTIHSTLQNVNHQVLHGYPELGQSSLGHQKPSKPQKLHKDEDYEEYDSEKDVSIRRNQFFLNRFKRHSPHFGHQSSHPTHFRVLTRTRNLQQHRAPHVPHPVPTGDAYPETEEYFAENPEYDFFAVPKVAKQQEEAVKEQIPFEYQNFKEGDVQNPTVLNERGYPHGVKKETEKYVAPIVRQRQQQTFVKPYEHWSSDGHVIYQTNQDVEQQKNTEIHPNQEVVYHDFKGHQQLFDELLNQENAKLQNDFRQNIPQPTLESIKNNFEYEYEGKNGGDSGEKYKILSSSTPSTPTLIRITPKPRQLTSSPFIHYTRSESPFHETLTDTIPTVTTFTQSIRYIPSKTTKHTHQTTRSTVFSNPTKQRVPWPPTTPKPISTTTRDAPVEYEMYETEHEFNIDYDTDEYKEHQRHVNTAIASLRKKNNEFLKTINAEIIFPEEKERIREELRKSKKTTPQDDVKHKSTTTFRHSTRVLTKNGTAISRPPTTTRAPTTRPTRASTTRAPLNFNHDVSWSTASGVGIDSWDSAKLPQEEFGYEAQNGSYHQDPYNHVNCTHELPNHTEYPPYPPLNESAPHDEIPSTQYSSSWDPSIFYAHQPFNNSDYPTVNGYNPFVDPSDSIQIESSSPHSAYENEDNSNSNYYTPSWSASTTINPSSPRFIRGNQNNENTRNRIHQSVRKELDAILKQASSTPSPTTQSLTTPSNATSSDSEKLKKKNFIHERQMNAAKIKSRIKRHVSPKLQISFVDLARENDYIREIPLSKNTSNFHDPESGFYDESVNQSDSLEDFTPFYFDENGTLIETYDELEKLVDEGPRELFKLVPVANDESEHNSYYSYKLDPTEAPSTRQQKSLRSSYQTVIVATTEQSTLETKRSSRFTLPPKKLFTDRSTYHTYYEDDEEDEENDNGSWDEEDDEPPKVKVIKHFVPVWKKKRPPTPKFKIVPVTVFKKVQVKPKKSHKHHEHRHHHPKSFDSFNHDVYSESQEEIHVHNVNIYETPRPRKSRRPGRWVTNSPTTKKTKKPKRWPTPWPSSPIPWGPSRNLKKLNKLTHLFEEHEW